MRDASGAGVAQALSDRSADITHDLRADGENYVVPIRIPRFFLLAQWNEVIRSPVQGRDARRWKRLRRVIPNPCQLGKVLEENLVHLRREVKKNLVDTRLLDTLQGRREGVPDESQDAARLQAVGVKRNLIRGDVGGGVRAVGPCVVALAPGGDVLGDEGGAELKGLGDGEVAGYAVGAGGVVDGDEALPGGVSVCSQIMFASVSSAHVRLVRSVKSSAKERVNRMPMHEWGVVAVQVSSHDSRKALN